MKKKSLIWSAIGISVFTCAAYLFFNLNAMIIRTTENIASEALGVDVHIGDIDLSLSNKKVTVSNILIDNPQGYRGKHILETNQVSITLNTASRELINFNSIQASGSIVNVEINEKGMNILDLKKLTSKNSKAEKKDSTAVNVIIKKMLIEPSEVNSRITFLDKDIATFKLPPVSFANVGNNGNTSAGDVITEIITQYLTKIEKQVTKKGILSDVSIPGINEAEKIIDGAADVLRNLF